ncbi:peptidylprolyl isomerase [Tautonia marina]|uniref:peptidylprolyl isomerase n=1 Tax=Tautonia marina TaxID=2653855 RepID=UPI0012605BB8|nr:peptidylprolyl isomerase [Tautonia marina]
MNRLVGLWIVAAVLIGCSQNREGLRPTEGLPPAALPPGLPPIQERVNAGPDPFPPRTLDGASMGEAEATSDGVAGRAPAAGAPARLVSTPKEPASIPDDPASIPAELPELPPEMPEVLGSADQETQADRTVGEDGIAIPPLPSAPSPARVDSQVMRASAEVETGTGASTDRMGLKTESNLAVTEQEVELPIGQPVGEWAARVESDIITWNELQSEVARRFRELDPQMQMAPGVRESLAANVLDHLIDRSLVIQRARRNELKDAKRWELINKFAVELFEKERLPALLNKYQVEDRYALERVLSERNESFEEILDSFKLETIYQQFLMMNVASKVHVDLPEMRAYYFEHRDDERFQQGPQLTWREIHVRFANHPSREAAQAKMDEVMARISQGAPFEEIARSMGEGPNVDTGGLWTTAPGSYAVSSVNAALGSLKPGQMSTVLEGPNGLHLVRLETVRPAGRKRFEEVQDEIRELLKSRKQTQLVDEYLKDLYRGAVVTTVFREYVPRHLREDESGG